MTIHEIIHIKHFNTFEHQITEEPPPRSTSIVFSFPLRQRFSAFFHSPDMTFWITFGYSCGAAPPMTTTSSCAWLFRCFRIRFAGGRLCRRGYACSVTCTRLLGFEAASYDALYRAWCSGPSWGSMSRIRIREPLLPRTSLSRPSEAADFPSGGRRFRLKRLKLIHPARIRLSISSDRSGVSATVPPK